MARLARSDVFAPDEITTLHLMARVVRRCFLLGDDPVTGKNYDHRKLWIEEQLLRLASCMGIDLLAFSILSNHFHLVVRTRPDVVATWDDTEVARRWLTLCPLRKCAEGGAAEITEFDLNSIRHDPVKLKEIRCRLSDPSWWMRLLCQRVATRANAEDEEVGKFFQARYRAVKLLDEAAILACAAYVDLNPIRAGIAETLEESDFTSAQRRIESLVTEPEVATVETTPPIASSVPRPRPNRLLSPVLIDELRDPLGAHASITGDRCSDKGFLAMSEADYLSLLDWTARQPRQGKCGATPEHLAPIFERLSISSATWCHLANDFGRMFHLVAGQPRTVEDARSRRRHARYRIPKATREMLATEG